MFSRKCSKKGAKISYLLKNQYESKRDIFVLSTLLWWYLYWGASIIKLSAWLSKSSWCKRLFFLACTLRVWLQEHVWSIIFLEILNSPLNLQFYKESHAKRAILIAEWLFPIYLFVFFKIQIANLESTISTETITDRKSQNTVEIEKRNTSKIDRCVFFALEVDNLNGILIIWHRVFL